MTKKTRLDNGVRIITEHMPEVHSVSIGIWVKAGSRNEHDDENGIAHFLEHMLFKGTDKRDAAEIACIIDSVGGFMNAFTTKEYTCFYVKVLKHHAYLALELLSDIFFNSQFSQEEIAKERNVIIQEIHMVKDTPDDYVQDLFNQSFFADHPLGTTILGEIETVQRFARPDMVRFFSREYLVPGKVMIVAAGNIDHDEFSGRVGELFSGMEQHVLQSHEHSFVPRRDVSCHFRELEQVHVCLGTPGLSQSHDKRHALFLMNTVLGGSMSSRLFQEIRENRGLAYSVFSYVTSYHDTGLFGIYLGVIEDTLGDSLDIVRQQLRRLRDERVPDTELINAKEQLKGNLLLALESTDSRMSRLAKCEMYFGEYVPVETVLGELDAVTPADIQTLANDMFRDDLCTYTFLGPVHENDLPPDLLQID